jgi:hypothetical protein
VGKSDRIGFLNVASNFTFDGGSLTMCAEFPKAKRWVDKYANEDGYVYPPIVQDVQVDLWTGKKARLPKTKRPTLLHRLPPSHELALKGVRDIQKSRLGLSGFVTQCFGFLFGTRLQFFDWWLEGRIPIKSTSNVYVDRKTAESFVSKAIDTWKKFDRRNKRAVSNLLYLYAKSGSLEWDWERFQMEYTVFDACYALMKRGRLVGHSPHGLRFKSVCQSHGLKYNGRLVRKFVQLRNDLLHEALWDGGQINTARGLAAFMASYHLRRFNHRLITAILTGRTEYTSSPWWFLATRVFRV